MLDQLIWLKNFFKSYLENIQQMETIDNCKDKIIMYLVEHSGSEVYYVLKIILNSIPECSSAENVGF